MERQITVERNYQGLDVLGYLSGICIAGKTIEITEEMIAQFETDTEGESNA